MKDWEEVLAREPEGRWRVVCMLKRAVMALDKGCVVLNSIDTVGLLLSVDAAISLTCVGHFGLPVQEYVEEKLVVKKA